jgi:hypothetical protein
MLESDLTSSIPGNEDGLTETLLPTQPVRCSVPSIPTPVRSPRRPDLPRSGSYSVPSASAKGTPMRSGRVKG